MEPKSVAEKRSRDAVWFQAAIRGHFTVLGEQPKTTQALTDARPIHSSLKAKQGVGLISFLDGDPGMEIA